MSRQYFGTDGVRGRVGEMPIVPEFALKLGWAAGKVLAASGKPSVVIGKDTRLVGLSAGVRPPVRIVGRRG
jgi:phosphoglucosamine mutase